MDRKQHWEDVYRQKPDETLSWFQSRSEISLELIHAAGLLKTDALIDVGGGVSRLVDDLLSEGFTDITVLDIAEQALCKSQQRLGDSANKVHWVSADITAWKPERKYHVWHDRAVFHFLSDAAERMAYCKSLEAALVPGATLILASFALDGPERCSGLPVQRYSSETLTTELGPKFRLTAQRHETHHTPADRIQQFQYSVFEYSSK